MSGLVPPVVYSRSCVRTLWDQLDADRNYFGTPPLSQLGKWGVLVKGGCQGISIGVVYQMFLTYKSTYQAKVNNLDEC